MAFSLTLETEYSSPHRQSARLAQDRGANCGSLFLLCFVGRAHTHGRLSIAQPHSLPPPTPLEESIRGETERAWPRARGRRSSPARQPPELAGEKGGRKDGPLPSLRADREWICELRRRHASSGGEGEAASAARGRRRKQRRWRSRMEGGCGGRRSRALDRRRAVLARHAATAAQHRSRGGTTASREEGRRAWRWRTARSSSRRPLPIHAAEERRRRRSALADRDAPIKHSCAAARRLLHAAARWLGIAATGGGRRHGRRKGRRGARWRSAQG